MKHLVIDRIPSRGERIRVEGERFHYLFHVRRGAVGDTLSCTDGAGRSAQCRVVMVDRQHAEIEALEETLEGQVSAGGPGEKRISLWIALLKGRKFDIAVRQATELGVDEIHPVLAQRCVSRPAAPELARKRERWQQIAVEAAQQSGRVVLPDVGEPVPLTALPPSEPTTSVSVVFHEKAVEEFPGTLPAVAAGGTLPEWRVLVGPEGGLAAGEVELLEKRGWHVRRMPTPVLRAETAVVVAGALVQYIARDYTSRFVR